MMDIDISATADMLGGAMSSASKGSDNLDIMGVFHYECTDSDGNLLWEDESHNLITTLGKNALLDNTLATPASLVGPFMGLISSVGFTAVAAADTMASHAGWNEAQGVTNLPDYTGNRLTVTFSAAAAGVKATSSTNSFVFTGTGGTVQGAFMCLNTGAVNTKNSTAGTLFNAGTLTTPQPVIAGNTLTVSWSGTLT